MIELMTSLHTNMGRVAEMFRSMDKDKSGRLERSEWLKGLSQYFSNEFDDMPLPGDLGPEPSPYSSRIIAESTHSLLLMDWLKCLWCCKK